MSMNIPRRLTSTSSPPWWDTMADHYNEHQELVITVQCPHGHSAWLRPGEVANDGEVSPLVRCPLESCSFHGYLKLEGWPP